MAIERAVVCSLLQQAEFCKDFELTYTREVRLENVISKVTEQSDVAIASVGAGLSAQHLWSAHQMAGAGCRL
jgi:hypothetical protein